MNRFAGPAVSALLPCQAGALPQDSSWWDGSSGPAPNDFLQGAGSGLIGPLEQAPELCLARVAVQPALRLEVPQAKA